MSDQISRRQFLGVSGLGLASLLTGLNPRPLLQPPPSVQRVHLHRFNPAETATTAAVRRAMLAATDLSWLHEGDSVFVKVASNSNLPAPSVTSPAMLEGVIHLLKEAGAGTVYVGDMSGALFVRHLAEETIGSTRQSMRENGLLAAAENAGATIHCFEEVPFAQAYVPGHPAGNHHWGDELQVAEILDRVDHIINLPRLGKHVLAGYTLGLKNAIGWVSDHSRMVLHRDGATLHEKIAEANAIPQLTGKTRLTMTLVDKALTTYGPDAGYHLELDHPLIVASEDVVSHDQVALMVLLWGRTQTPEGWTSADPYPAESNGFNWYFVRTTWGAEAAAVYQDLPTFNTLEDATALTQINYAYQILHGGRPERIEVVMGDMPLTESLLNMLTGRPELNLFVVNS